uniref:hypothetical protein n=1 Tax=Nocardioides sp. TaxID=35761 RepID=UPI00286CE7BD
MTATLPSAPGMTPDAVDGAVEGAVEDVEVLGLDAAATLSFVTGRRRVVDLAAAQELEGVAHWADLHRIGGLGSIDSEILDSMSIAEQLAADSNRRGVESMLRLAGQGAFMVEEYAVAEL